VGQGRVSAGSGGRQCRGRKVLLHRHVNVANAQNGDLLPVPARPLRVFPSGQARSHLVSQREREAKLRAVALLAHMEAAWVGGREGRTAET
jgi:hypothetical protein